METAETFTCADGANIHFRKSGPQNARARLLVIHGLGEHSGRYRPMVQELEKLGLQIWIPDLRGHGRSSGPRGHVLRFQTYIDDLQALTDILLSAGTPDIPLFLLGHSMGGLIAFHLCLHLKETVRGLALSSPMFNLASDLPLALRLCSGIMSALRPCATIANRVDPAGLSHDEAQVEAYLADPLVHDRISFRWLSECLRANVATCGLAPSMETPVLLQLAGADRIVNPSPSQRLFQNLASGDKTMYVYEGYYHEIFNETPDRRATAIKDLCNWMAERI